MCINLLFCGLWNLKIGILSVWEVLKHSFDLFLLNEKSLLEQKDLYFAHINN